MRWGTINGLRSGVPGGQNLRTRRRHHRFKDADKEGRPPSQMDSAERALRWQSFTYLCDQSCFPWIPRLPFGFCFQLAGHPCPWQFSPVIILTLTFMFPPQGCSTFLEEVTEMGGNVHYRFTLSKSNGAVSTDDYLCWFSSSVSTITLILINIFLTLYSKRQVPSRVWHGRGLFFS